MQSKTILKKAVVSLGLVAATFTFAAPPAGDVKLDKPNQVRGDEITPQQRESVQIGLEHLAKKQGKNGSFGVDAAYGGGGGGHVGITALSGIAFMSAGNLPGRGKYGDNVSRCLDFILASSGDTGFISSPTGGEMYSHGFATLFLGEVYGMTGGEGPRADEIKEKLLKAVKLIQRCQNQEGGWRYQPAPVDADISITIAQVMALRAARDAGIKVEKEVIDKAIKYVQHCQCTDGGFSYTAGGGGSGFARSAAGVAALYYAGAFEDKGVERGLAYLKNYLPGKPARNPENEGHYYYGNYYACQAMFLAGGDYWATWYPAIRDELIRKQNRQTGAWAGEAGEDYASAMSLIILQMPNRYLPVFHGKGQGS